MQVRGRDGWSVQMHHGLRTTRRSTRVLPERHVVCGRRLGRELVRLRVRDLVEPDVVALIAAGNHDASQMRQATAYRCDTRHHARVHDEDARSAIGEQLGVVLAGEMGRDRHRHGTDANRPEECRDELR